MEILGALALLTLGSAIGAAVMWLYVKAERPDNEVRRDAELRALRAAHTLAVARTESAAAHTVPPPRFAKRQVDVA